MTGGAFRSALPPLVAENRAAGVTLQSALKLKGPGISYGSREIDKYRPYLHQEGTLGLTSFVTGTTTTGARGFRTPGAQIYQKFVW